MAHGQEQDGRVIDLGSRRALLRRSSHPMPAAGAHSDHLADFSRGEEPDDYRHRMVTNAIAFVVVAALILAGLWLADSLARMRKNQDCVLSGKRGCTPVETPVKSR